MPVPAAARQPDRPGGRWFETSLALKLLREEMRQTLPLLAICYGRCGAYLRGHEHAPVDLSGNMVQQLLRLHRVGDELGGDLRCDDDGWPLQRESMDLIYLLHMLETSTQPASLLAEAANVLAPEGALIVIGFNPFSPWRLRWAGQGLHALSAISCRELLVDAGFEVHQQRGLGPVWPRQREAPGMGVREHPHADLLAPLRAGYALFARKRRVGLTPLRARQATPVGLRPGMHPG